MQVNSEVYGTRSTWRRDSDYGFSNSSTVPDDMQFKRGQYNRLIDYVNNNKMSFGHHIDYSICYAAHGENMPLAKQKTWLAKYTNGAWVLHKYERNENSGVGWFWGHQTGDWNSQAYQIYNPTNILLDKTETTAVHNDCWLPNGANANYPNQQSKLVIPIVEFNTKSVYFGIQCRIYRPSTNSQQIKWLSELRSGDWTDWKICSAWGVIYTYATNDATYTGVGASQHHCGVCANKELIFKNVDTNETTLPFLKYCQYIAASNSLPIFGWLYGDTPSYENYGGWQAVQRMDNMSKIFIDTVPNAVFNYYDHSGWGKAIEGYCTVTSENLEAIRKAAAAYGLFFTEQNPDNLRTNANRWVNNAMFCGVLDENGVGHGEYTQGAENRDNPVYNMGSSTNSNYNPTTPPAPVDPNTYSLTTGFNTIGTVASTTKQYVINGAGLQGLSGEMWSIMADLVTTPDDIQNLDNLSLDAFLTNNPIDAIVSVKKFPLLSVPHSESLENVMLGKYQTGAAAYALALQQATYNFTAIPIFPKFGNCFLDYAPYTTMQLYIPFCGTIDINPADFMGRNLSVEMNMDFITGAVTAYILSGGLVVQTATGNCAIDVPITGTESATVNAALENAILNEKSARGNYIARGSVGGMLTNPVGNISNPSNAVQTRFNTKIQLMKSNYELQHIQEPLRQIGAASPLNGWAIEFVCRLIIYYPDGEIISFNATNEPALITDKIKAFGDVNGFATVETGTLSNYSGFTVVSEIDLTGITATESELNEIRTLLQSGVYV